MDRSGDEQVARSALPPWEKAQSKPLRDDGETRRGASTSFNRFLAPEKAPDSNPDQYRKTSVTYRHERHTLGEARQHKSPQNTHKTTVFDLPPHTTVVGTKPGVAPTHAQLWPRIKRVFAAARREGLAQTFGALGHEPFAPLTAKKNPQKQPPTPKIDGKYRADARPCACSHTALSSVMYSAHAAARYTSQHTEPTTPQIKAPRTLTHYRTRHPTIVAPATNLKPGHEIAVRRIHLRPRSRLQNHDRLSDADVPLESWNP
jgi:hypothetical protein